MPTLTAQQVSARLGVKLDTVYAYVSRGVLGTRRESGSRRSLFDADEVEAVARRGRPRRSTSPSVLDFVVETELTTITDQVFRYRGRDAIRMARHHSFEETAHWLWTGTESGDRSPWDGYPITVPDMATVRDRIRAAVVMSSACEPLRADLTPAAVVATARALIATMVAAIPARSGVRVPQLPLGPDRRPIRGSIAGRLWTRLSPNRPGSPGLVAALNAALAALTDHELAPSTLAARVAASVRADPFSVVLAGLGPISGPLHGGASTLVQEMLVDAGSRGPEPALASALERLGHLPGFGHQLYPDGDPRAKLILTMLQKASPGSPQVSAAEDLMATAWRHSRIEPNIDFALAALTHAARMPRGAGETIFTIARTAGWIAHAIEEYTEVPRRFRAHAVPRRP